MMADELTKHVENNLISFLAKYKGQIEAVLPKHLTPTRVLKLIVGAINREPKLTQCTPMSVINAVLTASTMGLEIRQGSAYLVPFRDNRGRTPRMLCTLMIDYRGKIDLALRSNRVQDIDAEVVYSRDKFRIYRDMATGRKVLEHEPVQFLTNGDHMIALTDEKQRGEVIGAYAMAVVTDAPAKFVFMPKLDIDAIRARSKAHADGPWVTDYREMAKKTVIHRICKLLPQSPELALAQDIEDREDQGIPLDDIIDVQLEPEDEAPILPQSAEAAEEVAARKLATLQGNGGKAQPEQRPPTSDTTDADLDLDRRNRELDAEIMRKEQAQTTPTGRRKLF